METGINIIEWPLLQYCTMSALGGDALQRNARLHKSSFIIIDNEKVFNHLTLDYDRCAAMRMKKTKLMYAVSKPKLQ